MAIACFLGRHRINARGVRNGSYEFARCDRCRCDLMRKSDSDWKRVPKGYRVVWKPRGEVEAFGTAPAGTAAFARAVDLRGVTVIGERRHGAQRFALVVLGANDDRDYGAMVDPLGMDGPVAARIAQGGRFRPRREVDADPRSVFDMLMNDQFNAPLPPAAPRATLPRTPRQVEAATSPRPGRLSRMNEDRFG